MSTTTAIPAWIFPTASRRAWKPWARYLAQNGVTSFAPASMTLPYAVLAKAFATAKTLHDNRPQDCARLMGIQMEGPFFSAKKKGAPERRIPAKSGL